MNEQINTLMMTGFVESILFRNQVCSGSFTVFDRVSERPYKLTVPFVIFGQRAHTFSSSIKQDSVLRCVGRLNRDRYGDLQFQIFTWEKL